ncbi:MAG: hypothetical protein ABJA02_15165 [Acidobacteriota bacterium]
MRSIILVALAFMLACGVAFASKPLVLKIGELSMSKPGRCLLEVDGKKYISGGCRIELEKGGSFQIYDLKKHGYFAYVDVNGNTAEGYWNEDPMATHAQSPLGTLMRDGACWQNERAKVCAWR